MVCPRGIFSFNVSLLVFFAAPELQCGVVVATEKENEEGGVEAINGDLILSCIFKTQHAFLALLSTQCVSALYFEEEVETVMFSRDDCMDLLRFALNRIKTLSFRNNTTNLEKGNLGFSYGLNWALAGKGVIVKDKAFQNLTSSELQQKGATIVASLSGLPLLVRGSVCGGILDISKGHYTKLLKQAYGAIGSSSECDAKVRVISDNPSAMLKFSSILLKTPTRAVSHDSCPLTVYVATSISECFDVPNYFGNYWASTSRHFLMEVGIDEVDLLNDSPVSSFFKYSVYIREYLLVYEDNITCPQELADNISNEFYLESFPVTYLDYTIDGTINYTLWLFFINMPLPGYVGVMDAVGLGAQGSNGFIAADIERSSLILCGQAFADTNGIKEALTALSGPIICARGGLLLSGRLLVLADSVILLFAPEDTIQSCANVLVSADAGVILSSQGIAPLFQTGNSGGPDIFKLPAAVVFASSDCSGIIPSVAKLSPGQAAYHFLAGYQNGKFVPAYCKFPFVDLLDLAKAFLSKLKDHRIPSFLVNVKKGETSVTGKDLQALAQSTLSENIPPFEPEGGNLQEKYKTFLDSKFQEIPQEFSF
ncbi:hypothetical protein Pint_20993 [Pistacia integerrima]|uniref:Uncharacterized protein n=1 Tax=Pistacia integerrima TaxID=434235 RepID=A0ACC0XAK5_9ROSI|nr:hypothetical protein Pint_20993 [Pistacia integerrima]